jgi:hypothetical protein
MIVELVWWQFFPIFAFLMLIFLGVARLKD